MTHPSPQTETACGKCGGDRSGSATASACRCKISSVRDVKSVRTKYIKGPSCTVHHTCVGSGYPCPITKDIIGNAEPEAVKNINGVHLPSMNPPCPTCGEPLMLDGSIPPGRQGPSMRPLPCNNPACSPKPKAGECECELGEHGQCVKCLRYHCHQRGKKHCILRHVHCGSCSSQRKECGTCGGKPDYIPDAGMNWCGGCGGSGLEKDRQSPTTEKWEERLRAVCITDDAAIEKDGDDGLILSFNEARREIKRSRQEAFDDAMNKKSDWKNRIYRKLQEEFQIKSRSLRQQAYEEGLRDGKEGK